LPNSVTTPPWTGPVTCAAEDRHDCIDDFTLDARVAEDRDHSVGDVLGREPRLAPDVDDDVAGVVRHADLDLVLRFVAFHRLRGLCSDGYTTCEHEQHEQGTEESIHGVSLMCGADRPIS
jgi:hypothetical protein